MKCKQCGKCCHFVIEDEIYKCWYLEYDKEKYKCKIYHQPERIGTLINLYICKIYHQPKRMNEIFNFNKKCVPRIDSPFDYPKCPYNTNKPIQEMI